MSEYWDFFSLLVDSEPASIFVDLGIASEAPLVAFPQMGYVRVEMLRPREDGLSSQDEFHGLCALEDDLTAHIAANGGAIYVGRNTSGGFRDFYFYAENASQFTSAAEDAAGRHPSYRCEVGGRPDPDWRVYFDFLSPSLDDRQRMMNRHVIDRLKEHGDCLNVPRQIDHHVYFDTRDGTSTFIVRVEREGFRAELPSVWEESGFVIEFARIDAPDHDEITVMLARLARELGGEYGGWGCLQVSEPD
jgi:hypothetical protein